LTETRLFSKGLELEAVDASRKTDKECSVYGHVKCGVCNVRQSHQRKLNVTAPGCSCLPYKYRDT